MLRKQLPGCEGPALETPRNAPPWLNWRLKRFARTLEEYPAELRVLGPMERRAEAHWALRFARLFAQERATRWVLPTAQKPGWRRMLPPCVRLLGSESRRARPRLSIWRAAKADALERAGPRPFSPPGEPSCGVAPSLDCLQMSEVWGPSHLLSWRTPEAGAQAVSSQGARPRAEEPGWRRMPP